MRHTPPEIPSLRKPEEPKFKTENPVRRRPRTCVDPRPEQYLEFSQERPHRVTPGPLRGKDSARMEARNPIYLS